MISKRTGGEKYAIIVGKDRTRLESAAAGDLKKYTEKITGRSVFITDENLNIKDSECELVFVIGTPETNDLIRRLVNEKLVIIDKELGKEGLLIKTVEYQGKFLIVLAGYESPGSTYAAYHFLENYCGVGFFPDGDRLPKKSNLKFDKINCVLKPRFKYRVFFTHPYWCGPYIHCSRLWAFRDWKKEIDWMRRKRLNVLNPVHDDGTYLWGQALFDAFPEIKKNKTNTRRFVMLPEERTRLMKRVFQYARQNGIHISFNFNYSQVPDFFKTAHPELKYHEAAMGLSICASQSACRDHMKRLWSKIVETYAKDESHLYFLCAYQHERKLCDSFNSRAKPALQAYQVLKEIDPEAKIFFENWCWASIWSRPAFEWRQFHKLMPADAGIADWDTALLDPLSKAKEKIFGWYKPREWMILDHLSMEVSYPPCFVKQEKPKDIISLYRQAAKHGAAGIMAFNIMANTNELTCNLAAELGWDINLDEETFLRKYVYLRFGGESIVNMKKSYEYHLRSIDDGLKILEWGTYFTAETQLYAEFQKNCKVSRLNSRIKQFHVKQENAQKALNFALQENNKQKNNIFYKKYLFELNYVLLRWNGIISFYNSYKNMSRPEVSRKYFNEALKEFYGIKKIFSKKREFSMAATQKLGRGVKYNPRFLKDWQGNCHPFWQPHIKHMHVIWEHFDYYEKVLKGLSPDIMEDSRKSVR